MRPSETVFVICTSFEVLTKENEIHIKSYLPFP